MELGGRGIWLVVGALVLAAGCRSEPEWNDVRAPVVQPTSSVPVSTITTPTTTTRSSAVPSIVLPDSGVTSCVNAVQFGAFSGDEELSAVWVSAGSDPDTARSYCRDLASSDPVKFVDLGEGWDAVQALTSTSVASAPLDPALVIACVKRIEWGQLAGDPIYVRVWEDLGGGREFVDQACSTLVFDDPILAREMVDEVAAIEAFITTTG